MNNFQIAWIMIGIFIGLLMLIPFKRCLSTHNGLLSMLIASLMGIFSVAHAWIAIVIALVFFTFGIWKNQHKYSGVTDGETN